jgi:hypothetical protein
MGWLGRAPGWLRDGVELRARLVWRWTQRNPLGAAVAVVVLVLGIGTVVTSSDRRPVFPEGERACERWSSLVADGAAGVMTDAEVRTELQAIHEQVRDASPPAGAPNIGHYVERALAALTAGSAEGFEQDARMLSTACQRLGP